MPSPSSLPSPQIAITPEANSAADSFVALVGQLPGIYSSKVTGGWVRIGTLVSAAAVTIEEPGILAICSRFTGLQGANLDENCLRSLYEVVHAQRGEPLSQATSLKIYQTAGGVARFGISALREMANEICVQCMRNLPHSLWKEERREDPKGAQRKAEGTFAELKSANFSGVIADGKLSSGKAFEIRFSDKSAVVDGVHLIITFPGSTSLSDDEIGEATKIINAFVRNDPLAKEFGWMTGQNNGRLLKRPEPHAHAIIPGSEGELVMAPRFITPWQQRAVT